MIDATPSSSTETANSHARLTKIFAALLLFAAVVTALSLFGDVGDLGSEETAACEDAFGGSQDPLSLVAAALGR